MKKLGISDMRYRISYIPEGSVGDTKATFVIRKPRFFELILLGNKDLRLFSVRHELCHVKLWKMGFPLTNVILNDLKKLGLDREEYDNLVVICEYYVNELQKRDLGEWRKRSSWLLDMNSLLEGLPPLPQNRFSTGDVNAILSRVKKKKSESVGKA